MKCIGFLEYRHGFREQNETHRIFYDDFTIIHLYEDNQITVERSRAESLSVIHDVIAAHLKSDAWVDIIHLRQFF